MQGVFFCKKWKVFYLILKEIKKKIMKNIHIFLDSECVKTYHEHGIYSKCEKRKKSISNLDRPI